MVLSPSGTALKGSEVDGIAVTAKVDKLDTAKSATDGRG